MIKLHSVKLHKTDTCLTYVLKRIGQYKPEKTYSLKKYNEYFDSEEIDDKTILITYLISSEVIPSLLSKTLIF